MNVLKKLTVRNLKLNKKRTIVTIIGIMLSVALITTVATIYESFISSLVEYEKKTDGSYHVKFGNVPVKEADAFEKNRNVSETAMIEDIGYAKLSGSENEYKPYAFVIGYSDEAFDMLGVNIKEGRLPENDSEIVIPTHLKTSGRISMSVGDTVTLEVGKRVDEYGNELNQFNPYNYDEEENKVKEEITDTVTKTYTVVGIAERPPYDVEDYSAAGFTFITYVNKKDMTGELTLFLRYKKKAIKNAYEITANLIGIDSETFYKFYKGSFASDEEWEEASKLIEKIKYHINFNYSLITLESNPYNMGSNSGGVMLAFLIVCGIIVFTSVFCIKNSFDISITEKTREYGMLRSVGATRKQIKKNVMYEALILGFIGIPLGIFCGELASYILVLVSNALMGSEIFGNGVFLVFTPSWIAVLIAVILGSVTIYLSAFRSAKRAAKVSPIVSIRNSGDIKLKAKKLGVPKLISGLFGMGGTLSYKNLKRNKKKYRTTIISIAVSVMIFVALSSFMKMTFSTVRTELDIYDYDVTMDAAYYEGMKMDDNGEVYKKVLETTSLDNIKEYGIYKHALMDTSDLKWSKKYREMYAAYDEESENESIEVLVPDDKTYRKYIASLGLEYDDIKDKGILVDNIKMAVYDASGKEKKIRGREYTAQKGEVISGLMMGETGTDIKIGYLADEFPFGLNEYSAYIVISNELFEKTGSDYRLVLSYYSSDNPDKLQDDLEDMFSDADYHVNISNIAEQASEIRNIFLLVAIFLYGFIIVISLIGTTNIFNTMTTNMELRRKEFAMLKSVGMTTREFNRMIRLETVFMGTKSLLYGLPIGIVLSYLIYTKLGKPEGLAFAFPYFAIIIAVLAVFLLIAGIMKYSMSKINRQNTIETIRKDIV